MITGQIRKTGVKTASSGDRTPLCLTQSGLACGWLHGHEQHSHLTQFRFKRYNPIIYLLPITPLLNSHNAPHHTDVRDYT